VAFHPASSIGSGGGGGGGVVQQGARDASAQPWGSAPGVPIPGQDGFTNAGDVGAVNVPGGGWVLPMTGGLMFNGASWDRLRGDVANGLDVDVTRVAALPLPAGAATEATLASLLDAMTALEERVAGLATEATLETAAETLNDVGLTAILQREELTP
jgi:hypothetical protein